ncbi:coxsackievirus and adenovirus receptor homolog isoform X2 [Trachinotus anak]|uniref:coxsackievirus and adenovirus receptor homolog isoform X2 n=1 Tax=Trachinotus anak TaxID=443729 RepID=UPI0039F19694
MSRCLNSDPQTLTPKPGEDVTLPCWGPRDGVIELIRWDRPDLKSEGYVFFYRDERSYENYQIPSHRGRVELTDPQMKDGNVSVILKNVNINDAGRYECRVGLRGRKAELISNITLKVKDSVNITAEPGQTVSLSCRAPTHTKIIVVEWNRPDLKPEYVFLYQDGTTVTSNQHPSFKNRVELKDRDMKDRDVSVILKKVTRDDAGTYECRVIRAGSRRKRAADTEPNCIINLDVQTGHTAGHREEGGDKEGGDKNPSVGLGVGLSAALLVAAVVGFLIYRRRGGATEQPSYEPAHRPAEPPQV